MRGEKLGVCIKTPLKFVSVEWHRNVEVKIIDVERDVIKAFGDGGNDIHSVHMCYLFNPKKVRIKNLGLLNPQPTRIEDPGLLNPQPTRIEDLGLLNP